MNRIYELGTILKIKDNSFDGYGVIVGYVNDVNRVITRCTFQPFVRTDKGIKLAGYFRDANINDCIKCELWEVK